MVHPFLSRFNAFLGILGIPDPDSRILLENYLREPYGYNPAAYHVGRSSHLGLVSYERAGYSQVSGIAGGCESICIQNVPCSLASWTNVLRRHGHCYLDRRGRLGHLETTKVLHVQSSCLINASHLLTLARSHRSSAVSKVTVPQCRFGCALPSDTTQPFSIHACFWSPA